MNNYTCISIPVILFTICVISQLNCQALQESQGNKKVFSVGKTVNNEVTLEIKYPKESEIGDPIPITICLKNTSTKEIWYGFSGSSALCEFKLKLTNWKGEKVNRTQFGKRNIWVEGDMRKFKYLFEKLKPGESYCNNFDLAKAFDFCQTGTYTISIEKIVNHHQKNSFKIILENITFYVIE